MSQPVTGRFPADSPAGARALTVSQLNAAAKGALEDVLGEVWLTGEISGFRAYDSGHWYFQLKDDQASASAVMFRGANRSARVRPADGLQVLVHGRATLYEARGQFQVVVDQLEPAGEGALFVALEKLKKRLAAEGLFDAERKRPLPPFPRRIGVATSTQGAALRDILKVLSTRRAHVDVVIASCRVQGEGAAEEIACALRLLDRLGGLDAVIVGRGGGSLEDLWAFNEEAVVRAIYAMSVPVISAVGHEVDTTLADLVADVRAATPSQAAELICTSAEEVAQRLDVARRRLGQSARGRVREARGLLLRAEPRRLKRHLLAALETRAQRRDELAGRLARAARQMIDGRRRDVLALRRRIAPQALLARVRQRRDRAAERDRAFAQAMRQALALRRERLARLDASLRALSPLSVLDRGYAVVLTETGGVVRDASEVRKGERLHVRPSRGVVDVVVETTRAEA